MNSLSFQTSSPNGRLFSGWYRPLFIASSLASSDGHAYETSFQWNLSSNLAEKPFWMHTANNNISKNFIYFIFFFFFKSNKLLKLWILFENPTLNRYDMVNWISSSNYECDEVKKPAITPTDHRNDQFLSDANYVVTNYWGHYFWIHFRLHASKSRGRSSNLHNFSIMFWLGDDAFCVK